MYQALGLINTVKSDMMVNTCNFNNRQLKTGISYVDCKATESYIVVDKQALDLCGLMLKKKVLLKPTRIGSIF